MAVEFLGKLFIIRTTDQGGILQLFSVSSSQGMTGGKASISASAMKRQLVPPVAT